MDIILVILPVATLMAILSVVAFLWATRKGQFDDLDTPAIRVLFDEQERAQLRKPPPTPEPASSQPSEAAASPEPTNEA